MMNRLDTHAKRVHRNTHRVIFYLTMDEWAWLAGEARRTHQTVDELFKDVVREYRRSRQKG